MSPRRIQRRRTKGWRKPDGVVYVGRPTIFRNPFPVGATIISFPYRDAFGPHVLNPGHAVEIFRTYARITSGYEFLVRRELGGKDLMCWCPLDRPCHADVLLEIANGGAS